DKLVEWLSPINFFLHQQTISESRSNETGYWLLEDPQFQAWKSGPGRTLWCHGIHVLPANFYCSRSLVVEHFSTDAYKTNRVGIACIYLNHQEGEDQTPAKLLAGVWRQLVLD
ncbi:hypothetical protein DFH08DRAFT_620292, partial [Mycena albidolilacea]